MRFPCPYLCPCLCLCCLPCSSNMTARKGSQRAVGSRRGLLQQCNTKYYKQAELAKSSAKLLPNSSIRSKQGIFLFFTACVWQPCKPQLTPLSALPCIACEIEFIAYFCASQQNSHKIYSPCQAAAAVTFAQSHFQRSPSPLSLLAPLPRSCT